MLRTEGREDRKSDGAVGVAGESDVPRDRKAIGIVCNTQGCGR